MRWQKLEHRFVGHIPERLQPGVLYISTEFNTVTHVCCCGCGEEIVTPLSPVGWRMTFDGESVSLWPSVGNWTLPCRSHYVIEQGNVIEAYPWTDAEVAAERRRDKAAKERHFGAQPITGPVSQPNPEPTATPEPTGWWSGLWRLITGPKRVRSE